jgi:hypothetical protein
MSISISNIRPALSHEWDRIWQGCSYSTYFHSREWSEIWDVYTGHRTRPAPMMVAFSDGKIALFPLSVSLSHKTIVKTYLSSPAGTYGGWISDDELGVAHSALLAGYLTRLSSLIWRLNPYDPLLSKIRVRNTQEDETHACNLAAGFDAVCKQGTKGHRSAAAKACREGVIVKEANTAEEWRAYYRVYEDSLRRWGGYASSRYEWGMFDEMFRRRSPRIKLWLAVYQDELVAGALCFYAPTHAVCWHGAALESYFYLRPVNLLMREAVRDACDRGLTWFDFNPSGGHEGVKAFKKSFGAQPLSSPSLRIQGNFEGMINTLMAPVRKLRHLASALHSDPQLSVLDRQ